MLLQLRNLFNLTFAILILLSLQTHGMHLYNEQYQDEIIQKLQPSLHFFMTYLLRISPTPPPPNTHRVCFQLNTETWPLIFELVTNNPHSENMNDLVIIS